MKSEDAMNLEMNQKAKGKMYQLTKCPQDPCPTSPPATFPNPSLSCPSLQSLSVLTAFPFLPWCPGVKQVRSHAVCVACLQDNIWLLCGVTSFFTSHFFVCFSLIWKEDNEVVAGPLCRDREKQQEKHFLVLASEATHTHLSKCCWQGQWQAWDREQWLHSLSPIGLPASGPWIPNTSWAGSLAGVNQGATSSKLLLQP